MARLALLLASLLVLTACGGGSGERGSPATATDAAAEPGLSLGGQTLDGESLSLDQFRGKPLYVNVWASW
jgi:ABC-type glycerol-3-phosphate transport system substrate-binding protein